MNGLILWERIILESLNRQDKNLEDLFKDTAIKREILKNILRDLLEKGIIYEEGQTYHIRALNLEKDAVKDEIKDLFSSLVELYFKNKSQIKLKKVYLTTSELEIFQTLLSSLEGFLEKISRVERNVRLYEQQVVVWGHAEYASLLEEI